MGLALTYLASLCANLALGADLVCAIFIQFVIKTIIFFIYLIFLSLTHPLTTKTKDPLFTHSQIKNPRIIKKKSHTSYRLLQLAYILLILIQKIQKSNSNKIKQPNIINVRISAYSKELEVAGEDVTGLNEDLLDKLRLLQYEKQYVQKGNKLITSASFSFATNPTQQFNNFKNLIKWLFQLNDISSSEFSKYDDPMTVSTTIINQCKKIGIQCDFPPLKLKAGCGQQVVSILDQLAWKALKRKNFGFKKPKYEQVKQLQEEKPQDTDQKIDEGDEMMDEVEMGEEEQMDDRDNMGGNAAIDEDKQIIISAVSENDWKLQCERVANKLKTQSKHDTKQWRSHMDTLKTSSDFIKKNFPNSRSVLQKMNQDLSKTLQRISKSQGQINSSMSSIGEQYKSQSQQLKKLNIHYNNLSNSIKQMNENHRLVSEKLQQILSKTNEHSGSMTDSSPVVKIKDAYKIMLAEIKAMDVRMGVLSHTILQYKAKQKNVDKKNKILDVDELEDLA